MLYMVGAFLFFVLFLLMLILFVLKRPKKTELETASKVSTTETQTIDALIKILKTEKKNRSALEGMVEKVANELPFPKDEREATKYFEFVYYYAKNPLTTAKMIVYMDKTLSLANPKYAKQIEDFQMRGIDARKA